MDIQPPTHIALIDDEKSVAFALRLLLQALGFSVTEFTDPIQALARLYTDLKPDLLLCDLRMPEKNGFEVLVETKKHNPSLPVILMSAHATSEEAAHAIELGASDVIMKPFSPQEFRQKVTEILSRPTI